MEVELDNGNMLIISSSIAKNLRKKHLSQIISFTNSTLKHYGISGLKVYLFDSTYKNFHAYAYYSCDLIKIHIRISEYAKKTNFINNNKYNHKVYCKNFYYLYKYVFLHELCHILQYLSYQRLYAQNWLVQYEKDYNKYKYKYNNSKCKYSIFEHYCDFFASKHYLY